MTITQTTARPSRLKILMWSTLIILAVWGLMALSLLRQPSLSADGQRWLLHTERLSQSHPMNDSFFMMLGFDAPIDASNQAFGDQRWRQAQQINDQDLVLAEPSTWRFGLPCYISRVECWSTIERAMPRIKDVLAEQRPWMVRLQQLLAADAPLGPLDQPLDDISLPKAQLSSALELNLAAVMVTLVDGEAELAFAQLNDHLTDVLRHLRATNIRLYQALLQRALRVELGWVVALLQQRPELAQVAAKQLTILAEQPQLMTSLAPVLRRDFSIANQVFETIDQGGVAAALDWKLGLSAFMQQLTWQRQTTVNQLALSYQYAQNLIAGQHQLTEVIDAAKRWPNQADNWRDRNLIGSALLQEKYEQLSSLVRAAVRAEAYYGLAVDWILAAGEPAKLASAITVLGQQVEVVDRTLEQRRCLAMPLLESLDEFCLRLYRPGQVAKQLSAQSSLIN